MKNIDKLTKQYSLSKTLKFSLIPIGKTLENYESKDGLTSELILNKKVKNIKKYISECLFKLNDYALSQNTNLKNLSKYADLYFQNSTDIKKVELDLRKEIAKILSPVHKKTLKRKEFISIVVPSYVDDEDKKNEILEFSKFTSYFTDYLNNCENLFAVDESTGAIPFRCINDNLPRFLDNIKIYNKVIKCIDDTEFNTFKNNYLGIYDATVNNMFTVDYFNFALSQSEINVYNYVVERINNYINLYNKSGGYNNRLPHLKALYKQIGSKIDNQSILPPKFKSDNELLETLYDYFNNDNKEKKFISLKTVFNKLKNIFNSLFEYNLDGVFIKCGNVLNTLSILMFDNVSMLKGLLKQENYNGKSISISQLQNIIDNSEIDNIEYQSIVDCYKNRFNFLLNKVFEHYNKISILLSQNYQKTKKLKNCKQDMYLIKGFLDSIKNLEKFAKLLIGTGKENNKDELFYDDYLSLINQFYGFDVLYTKVRNYFTQKPYSLDKYKLSFDNPQFMEGWAKNQETARSVQLFTKDGLYYLGVMDNECRKKFKKPYNNPIDNDDIITKIVYEQIPNPSRIIQNLLFIDGETVKKNGKKNSEGINTVLEELKNKYLPSDINKIRKLGSYKITSDNFNKDDLSKYIAYYIDRVKDYYNKYNFTFKSPSEYSNFGEFTNDIDNQAYQITFVNISFQQLMSLVDKGELYLFQIYNKDFSSFSKGKENLHTMYFKMLFDERNLTNVVYRLQGGAEMFYRPASIDEDDVIIHEANKFIVKRTYEDKINDINNPTDEEKSKYYSIFDYDIVKDRRFVQPQFSLHLSVEINSKLPEYCNLNNTVRTIIKKSNNYNIMGISRGINNLLFAVIVDSKGNILHKESFNIIKSNYNNNNYNVDYFDKIEKRNDENQKAKQDWASIEEIKYIKRGYISQVVQRICELIVGYDAIVMMESANSKEDSTKLINQNIYKQFIALLENKLNYYVDKNTDMVQCGGLLNAYQLTNKIDNNSYNLIQNGLIFYVNKAYTSVIDPTTGFVNKLFPQYRNIEKAHDFISNIDDIRYNQDENYFEFNIDYEKFGIDMPRKKWTICSYGNRIKSYSQSSCEEISLTDEYINIFNNGKISYHKNIKEQLFNSENKSLLEQFINIFKLNLRIKNHSRGLSYIISPIKNKNGDFYFCRNEDVDMYDTYNMICKGSIILNKIKKSENINSIDLSIDDNEWFSCIQNII